MVKGVDPRVVVETFVTPCTPPGGLCGEATAPGDEEKDFKRVVRARMAARGETLMIAAIPDRH